MPYRVGSNTVITEGDASPASANGSFRNFFYRYGLSPATYPGTVGSSYGYITGGVTALLTSTYGQPFPYWTQIAPLYYGNPTYFSTTVERFPFSNYINSVQVSGALSTSRASFASQSSKTAGYNSGGYIALPTVGATPNTYYQNVTASSVVDSFPFVSMGIITVSSAGNLSAGRFGCAGHQSDTSGFTSSGASSNTTFSTVIDSFPFSSFTTATSVATLSPTRIGHGGHSSPVSGYTSGGFNPISLISFPGSTGPGLTAPVGTTVNNINRYPFSVSPAPASSVSTLTTARGWNMGVSSAVNGYTCGGTPGQQGIPTAPSVTLSSIERFNFSEQTVTSAVNPQTLSAIRIGGSGISSSEYGYICGGFAQVAYYFSPSTSPAPPFPQSGISTVDIFPFASTTTTAGTISMTTGKGNIGGNQY